MDTDRARILIVDDDEAMVRTTSMILERKGYDVDTASSGEEALDAVREEPYDIIFMDIRMPVMDGVETHRKLKEIRPDAAVMMMTAYAVEDLVKEAIQDGACGILYKPLDFEKVMDIIQRAQEKREGALILVVDDDRGMCKALREVLTEKCYPVATAFDGEQAVEAARERQYDIIFIDMKLPTINGLETYLAIREVDPEVVAVMMTAYGEQMEELVEAALDRNAYACLQKPFDVEELLSLVEEILERRGRRAEGGVRG